MIDDGDGDTISKGGASIAKAGDGISKDGESGLGERRLVEDMAERVSYSEALTVGSSGVELKPDFIVKDGVVEVAIPEEVFADVVPLWKYFFVGYFMNEAPHIGPIHATVNRIWNLPGKRTRIDVQFIGKTTVLFRIEDEEVRKRVLKKKFWHISEVPLMLGEWTPETARPPPGLSAMPLWVDLSNVPGYLYSKEGLKFLARTSGKFIKLHPHTEHCVRMDVATVLVEVDLTKPLPNTISFRDREGRTVLVSITYPWLPPRCHSCSKWGHLAKDCVSQKTPDVVCNQPADVTNEPGTDIVELEGFSSKEATKKASTEIVATLITELESMSSKENLSNKSCPKEVLSLVGTKQQVEINSADKWALVTTNNGGAPPPVRAVEGCFSPNGFQLLQDMREEGEID
ncbi:hypothetical protein Bca52824_039489 [Brassica carinata]|uniref:CCHC-type domain-containing protein n=1 Tax=Brassica carinata TaxID=52824 RepID=A0A8X7RR86_BRACI|nr:hypothetical protein Bca52824_039489 [Brassica carinata]